MTKSAYLKIPLDFSKRHLIVGDVHGHYHALLRLLDSFNYDESKDVVYSVGDLIDRGPKSVEVIEFFKRPNCWAARGNHEQMLVNHFNWKNIWLNNGGVNTLDSLDEHGHDIHWLEDFCRSLPVCLDVGENDDEGAFRIIHAELPPNVQDEELLWTLNEHPMDAAEGVLLWGRRTVTRVQSNIAARKAIDAGIEFAKDWTKRNVFCGHTPTRKVVRVGNMWWIDTFASRTMTMMNAITHEQSSVDVFVKNP
jgi:serine/threonine protein phosphatase 1